MSEPTKAEFEDEAVKALRLIAEFHETQNEINKAINEAITGLVTIINLQSERISSLEERARE